MGSLWIQTYRLNPSKPSSQESRGFNHESVNESDAFAAALTLSPDQASQAHAFATKLLQTAKQVPVLKADQKRMLEETQKNIEEEEADRREINTASHNLTLVQKDTQTVDAAKRAADAAIARKTGVVAQQHNR